jgi:hypothetical protein
MSQQDPWDEIMGPPPSRATLDETPLITTSIGSGTNSNNGSGAAFTTSSRWSQYEKESVQEETDAATAKAVYLAANALAEREMAREYENDMASTGAESQASAEDEYHNAIKSTSSNNSVGSNSNFDHETIRQEALRMLEVADADRNYSVYRTVSGGFSATPKPKTRAALSGLNLTASRTNFGRAFRYDRNNNNNDPPSSTDMEYGANPNAVGTYEDDDVVDVIGMERRSLASTSDQENRSNGTSWSSRYSIDNTLLAMTGGTVSKSSVSSMRVNNDPYSTSNARILERMDRESRNTQAKSASATGGFIKGGIFGSAAAFNYRQAHVFGKQNVVLPSSRQPNLQAAFLNNNPNNSDSVGESLPPVNQRTKSWQERLQQKRFQTRLLIMCAVLLIFVVTFTSVMVSKNRAANQAAAATAAAGLESVTFYVTADIPLLRNDESKLYKNLQSLGDQGKFIVHVGNIQMAAQTQCDEERYSQISDMLQKSSPKTVFIVPGTEDWNQCPDPMSSWETWKESFMFFSENFVKDDAANDSERTQNKDGIETYHMKEQLENWAFVESGVLFMGVHAIGGIIRNETEFATRNYNNYQWIRGMASTHLADIRALVLFGNVRPGTEQNSDFFGPLSDLLKSDKYINLPSLYVHGYSERATEDKQLYQPFLNVPNLMAYSYMKGSETPLTRMNVGFGATPFIVG